MVMKQATFNSFFGYKLVLAMVFHVLLPSGHPFSGTHQITREKTRMTSTATSFHTRNKIIIKTVWQTDSGPDSHMNEPAVDCDRALRDNLLVINYDQPYWLRKHYEVRSPDRIPYKARYKLDHCEEIASNYALICDALPNWLSSSSLSLSLHKKTNVFKDWQRIKRL